MGDLKECDYCDKMTKRDQLLPVEDNFGVHVMSFCNKCFQEQGLSYKCPECLINKVSGQGVMCEHCNEKYEKIERDENMKYAAVCPECHKNKVEHVDQVCDDCVEELEGNGHDVLGS